MVSILQQKPEKWQQHSSFFRAANLAQYAVLATREQNKVQSQNFITYFCTLLSNMTKPYTIQQKGEAKPEHQMFKSQHAISSCRKPPEKVHWRWWQLVTELGMPHGIQSSQDDQ